MTLEIAVFNIESALAAISAGADRLELCENPFDGGTTPSYGTLKKVREKVIKPVFPIIRPRGGDFLYTEAEFEVMLTDVALVKELGFDGLVIGALNADGSVAKDAIARLVEIAYPLEVTFHRAFDRTKDPFAALEEVIQCGCQRLLTSGQVPNAFDAKDLIRDLVEIADDRIIIMPGSGVRSNNISELAAFTGVKELHSSARKSEESQMNYLKISMNERLDSTFISSEEIIEMKNQLSLLNN